MGALLYRHECRRGREDGRLRVGASIRDCCSTVHHGFSGDSALAIVSGQAAWRFWSCSQRPVMIR
jgi:hypothetical protein